MHNYEGRRQVGVENQTTHRFNCGWKIENSSLAGFAAAQLRQRLQQWQNEIPYSASIFCSPLYLNFTTPLHIFAAPTEVFATW